MTVLQRGTVIVKTTSGSYEAGIVDGPSRRPGHVALVIHGYVDGPPTAGDFDLSESAWERGIWRRATPEEAEQVRKWFLEHARSWGPDSKAWVAADVPATEKGGGS